MPYFLKFLIEMFNFNKTKALFVFLRVLREKKDFRHSNDASLMRKAFVRVHMRVLAFGAWY